MASDDNGQDLTNYNFAQDGFRAANTNNDVYLPSGGSNSYSRNIYFIIC